MAKQRDPAHKKSGRSFQQAGNADVLPFERNHTRRGQNHEAPANGRKRFSALKEAQTQYYLAMKSHRITFGLGPAGTGKSHVAVALACEQLMDKEIDQIVVTRPIVGVDEDMGFLPGELEEKFDPYFAPIRPIMEGILGYNNVESLIRSKRIIVKPLQFIRGCTFDRSFMLLDEAQNTTCGQMKAFLTRIGKFSTVAVNGDIEQIDLPSNKPSGLVDILERTFNNPVFGRMEFTEDDIVRDDIVKDVLKAYRLKIA
jgi:phosphate starvation-inducible PhoH-like protein